MDHMNQVILEGCVVFTPELNESGGKKALNFLIENVRKGRYGETRFRYNCVAWGSIAERIVDKVKEGRFVRIFGHLQDNTREEGDGKVFHYSKTCVDHIDFEE